MLDPGTQIAALITALEKGGFAPFAEVKDGSVLLRRLPEFKQPLAFRLTITMDDPLARQWDSLFDGCLLESGAMVKGAAHQTATYSRKKAVERAKQEKWAAVWSLYDAGILPAAPQPDCARWQDISLP